MVPMAEWTEERLNLPTEESKSLEYAAPWIDYAIEHTRLLQKDIEHGINSFTKESLQNVKSNYLVDEDIAFGKIRASHPALTAGVVTGSGLILLKRPRRVLFYKTIQLFQREESMLSRAEAKVKELRQSIDLLKAESAKVERKAQLAVEEMIRHEGKHIQSQIRSVYKVEGKAAGLKDIIRELPRREAFQLKSQISKLASKAKRERSALRKDVTKINYYGISV